jgi:hypothetical protein
VHARLHPRLEHGDRAVGFLELPCHLDLERRTFMVSSNRGRDACKHITRQEPDCQPVRVVENDGVIDTQTKR